MNGITTVFLDIDDTLWWFSRNSELALASTFKLMGCAEWCRDYDAFHDHYEHFNHELWQLYNKGDLRRLWRPASIVVTISTNWLRR